MKITKVYSDWVTLSGRPYLKTPNFSVENLNLDLPKGIDLERFKISESNYLGRLLNIKEVLKKELPVISNLFTQETKVAFDLVPALEYILELNKDYYEIGQKSFNLFLIDGEYEPNECLAKTAFYLETIISQYQVFDKLEDLMEDKDVNKVEEFKFPILTQKDGPIQNLILYTSQPFIGGYCIHAKEFNIPLKFRGIYNSKLMHDNRDLELGYRLVRLKKNDTEPYPLRLTQSTLNTYFDVKSRLKKVIEESYSKLEDIVKILDVLIEKGSGLGLHVQAEYQFQVKEQVIRQIEQIIHIWIWIMKIALASGLVLNDDLIEMVKKYGRRD